MFAAEQHVEVEATWGICQRIVATYRNPDRASAKTSTVIGTAATELITLGRALKRRAADVLAYLDWPEPVTDRSKRSPAGSNAYAAPSWASATSPTTSRDHDHNYTPSSDELGKF